MAEIREVRGLGVDQRVKVRAGALHLIVVDRQVRVQLAGGALKQAAR